MHVTAVSLQPADILFEDNHLLVVCKPALLPTMGVSPELPSLVSQAKAYVKRKYNKPGNVYLGIVSRLDAHASGVIVLARTSKAAARLARQFHAGTVEKTYLAIVEGSPNPSAGTLENWLVKDERQQRMQVVRRNERPPPAALRAVLQYKVLGTRAGLSLVEIQLQTGRKHQIRVQLAHHGTPVLGDRKYGARRRFQSGIALHASRLTIEHPTEKRSMTFHRTPPGWWGLGRFSEP